MPEAMAMAQAGAQSRGATCYVTLEPCAHVSPRGPACSDLLIAAGVARVVIALDDPDMRTDGEGIERLIAAGIAVATNVRAEEARRAMAGFLTRQTLGRPHVTLKLALSLDGAMAQADGTSKWITGSEARAHAHLGKGAARGDPGRARHAGGGRPDARRAPGRAGAAQPAPDPAVARPSRARWLGAAGRSGRHHRPG